MRFHYFGHSCFGLQLDPNAEGPELVFDPFISPNPKASKISLETLDPDYVLLSHGHADHVADAQALMDKGRATLIAAFEITEWYGKKGVEKAHGMNLGGGFDFPFGRLKYVPALHSSALPDGSYGGPAGGFVLERQGEAIWYAGDTALTRDFRLLGEQHELHWAILPIGDNFTMGAADAALAASYAGVHRVIGVHYDTFPPIEIDHDQARKAFADLDIELHLPAIGEVLDLA
jgi:L-ascorbate metabolism protein UlaG (beta-lactamase superfamily)